MPIVSGQIAKWSFSDWNNAERKMIFQLLPVNLPDRLLKKIELCHRLISLENILFLRLIIFHIN